MANAINIVVNAQDRASKKIKNITKTFDNLESKAKKVSGVITGVGAVAGVALAGVAVAGAQQNSVLEQSEARWTTLLKSSEKAEKQMAWMKNFAKQTPFDYKAIDETATAMNGMGLSMKQVNKWLPALGDASATLGGGSETVQGLGRALGQMNAKGKVSAEEMQQLAERGVNAWGMLADGMNMTQGEVRKLSEDGKLLAKDALPLIYEGMNKTFGGGTKNLMKSTTGQAMLARENFSKLAGTLTQGAFDWFGATVLPLINTGMEKLTSVFEGGITSGFQKLATGSTKAQAGLAILAGAITTFMIPALINLKRQVIMSVIPMLTAFAPFIAIGAVVAGLALIIMKNWESFAPYFQGIFNVVKTAVAGFKDSFMVAFQNLQAGLTPIWEAVKHLFNTLKPVILAVGAIVGTVLGAMIVTAMAVFNGIITAIAPLVEAFVWLGDMVANVIGAVVALLTGDMNKASKLWQNATDSAIKFVQKLWEAFKGFFSGFINTIVQIFSSFGVDIVSKAQKIWSKVKSKFVDGLNNAKSAVSDGLKNIVSTITGWAGDFVDSGKGLLNSFTKGIKKGISKAVGAVQDGMSKIRDFLPFSPAKKGALSDLDKSGKSFFPTFAGGLSKGLSPMLKMAERGMGELSSMLAEPQTQLESMNNFSFGRQRVSMTVNHKIKGSVEVNGGKGTSETVKLASKKVQETFEDGDFLSDFRRASRSL
ncbi:tape measure protein [Pseudalkalibacillus sp. A8]|uniref:tape measure protein n=1 Tax=Pseudalkalibacillus sp. A8 TaxID=3382641 RepID=UPI0038B5E3CC